MFNELPQHSRYDREMGYQVRFAVNRWIYMDLFLAMATCVRMLNTDDLTIFTLILCTIYGFVLISNRILQLLCLLDFADYEY